MCEALGMVQGKPSINVFVVELENNILISLHKIKMADRSGKSLALETVGKEDRHRPWNQECGFPSLLYHVPAASHKEPELLHLLRKMKPLCRAVM